MRFVAYCIFISFALIGCSNQKASVLNDKNAETISPDDLKGHWVPKLIDNISPWFNVPEKDLALHSTYAWLGDENAASADDRLGYHLGIFLKVREMLRDAKGTIFISAFLFDNMKSDNPNIINPARWGVTSYEEIPEHAKQQAKLVEDVTNILLAKQRAGNQVIFVTDPMHRAYGDRLSPFFQRMYDEGIIIVYSDLLVTSPGLKGFPELEKLHEDPRYPTLDHFIAEADIDEVRTFLSDFLNYAIETQVMAKNSWLVPIKLAVLIPIRAIYAALSGIPLPDFLVDFKDSHSRAHLRALVQKKLTELDGAPVSFTTLYHIALSKANHRKILTVQYENGEYEALISSANPHVPSLPAANHAISVKGTLAQYIIGVMANDLKAAVYKTHELMKNRNITDEEMKRLQSRYYLAKNHDFSDQLKLLEFTRPLSGRFMFLNENPSPNQARVKFMTERGIKDAIINMLRRVQPTDHVRLQMFYLSDMDVVAEIMLAAARTDNQGNRAKFEMLLDYNRDAFNKEKNGTPNRQVARHILKGTKDKRLIKILKRKMAAAKYKYEADDIVLVLNGLDSLPSHNLHIRWWLAPFREQNHAKIMSVTNKDKAEIINGSANWTGKNIDGPNFESNIMVLNAPTLVKNYNDVFHTFWVGGVVQNNNVGRQVEATFSLPYDANYKGTQYDEVAGSIDEWIAGEIDGTASW